MDLSFEPESYSGWSPLFPLPGVVLLPGALLPLHVFEPRYRLMLRDALAGEKLIAMALLTPGFEATYDAAPPIEEWVGLGRIVAHEPLADGRSNLLLAGLRRARVLEEDRSRPYRLGRLEVLDDDEASVGPEEARALRAELFGAIERLAPRHVRNPERLSVFKMPSVPLGALVDLAADALHLTPQEKQSLLAEPRVLERAAGLTSIVVARLEPEGPGRYPPRFSRN